MTSTQPRWPHTWAEAFTPTWCTHPLQLLIALWMWTTAVRVNTRRIHQTTLLIYTGWSINALPIQSLAADRQIGPCPQRFFHADSAVVYDRLRAARATSLRVDALLAAIDSAAMLAAKALLASRLQAAETPGAKLRGPWSSFLIPLWCEEKGSTCSDSSDCGCAHHAAAAVRYFCVLDVCMCSMFACRQTCVHW